MHMGDALLSPAVGLAMDAVSVAAIGVSAAKINRDEFGEKKVPIMGVAGAMVFAAQMINFTIPGTGSSGHIVGGALLAGLLGGVPAFLSISAVLIIQCLFFADGGLLALGCNIFNMGVIPCLLAYPLVFKPIMNMGASKTGAEYRRLAAASVASAVVGLELGALCVVLQTRVSGIAELPFAAFAGLMLPIHLAIGLVEGVVTASVLCFVYKMRPELIEAAKPAGRPSGVPAGRVIAALAALALVAGGILSLFASKYPDGLEWAVEKTAGRAEAGAAGGGSAGGSATTGGIAEGAAAIQEGTAVFPDYSFASDPDNAAGTSASGVIGAAATFALAGAAGLAITKLKKRKKAAA